MSSSPLPHPDWLSAREVAAYFEVSISLIYKVMADGKLKYSQIGNLKKVRREDFDAYLRAVETGATPKP